MTTLSPSTRTLLRQHLTENFSQTELEELAFDLGLDAETLLRETKSEFARALILHFEDRDDAERLAREVLARRPDPVLEQDIRSIAAHGPAAPPATPVSTPQPQRLTSRVWLAILAMGVVTALAIVFALIASRQPSGNNTSPAGSTSAITTSPAGIASNVPGTPLALNETIRSGVDDQLKRRDVWRVNLQAMKPYTIEVRSNVQDGIALGVLRPSALDVPDTVETTDLNFCSFTANCYAPFTPIETGDYYVVVYGMRPSAAYDLIVRDK